MKFNAYLNNIGGTKQSNTIIITEKQYGDVNAIYIDGVSDTILDSELSAIIEISPNGVKRWMANYMISEHWCGAKFGAKLSEIPDKTQGLICECDNGEYLVIFPVVSEEYKCVLAGDGKTDDVLTAKLINWYEGKKDCKAVAFLWGISDNPYALLEECVKMGLELLGIGCLFRTERTYPKIFEYLGWCSWDAFQIRVDEESLIAKCEEFKNKNIPVRWAILDDMWGEVRDFYGKTYSSKDEMIKIMHNSRLYSFEADPIRFPNGLKKTIEKINKYGIKVGIWHPTTGYWKGIDADSNLFCKLNDSLIKSTRYIYS